MPYTRRERFGLWLERFPVTHTWIMRYSHTAPDGRYIYVNVITGHLTTKATP